MNIAQLFEQHQNLVVRKATSNPNLFVLKYKRAVFAKDLWNDFLRECRGLVVDQHWNIVALPFSKIHNYGVEKAAPEFADDEPVFVSRKVNGFMVACTWFQGDLLWSTTGSIDSDFCTLASKQYQQLSDAQRSEFKAIIQSAPTTTFLFECVDPSDPHIVHEDPGLYFLGCRAHDFNAPTILRSAAEEAVIWAGTGVKIVETCTVMFADLKQMAKTCKHEGFVFESEYGSHRVSKIKSPHYLTKKFLMRGNWEKFQNKSKDLLDEEFFPLYSYIYEVEQDRFFELDEIARREFIEQFFGEYNDNQRAIQGAV